MKVGGKVHRTVDFQIVRHLSRLSQDCLRSRFIGLVFWTLTSGTFRLRTLRYVPVVPRIRGPTYHFTRSGRTTTDRAEGVSTAVQKRFKHLDPFRPFALCILTFLNPGVPRLLWYLAFVLCCGATSSPRPLGKWRI